MQIVHKYKKANLYYIIYNKGRVSFYGYLNCSGVVSICELHVTIRILKQRNCDHLQKALGRAHLSTFPPGGKVRVRRLRQFIRHLYVSSYHLYVRGKR